MESLNPDQPYILFMADVVDSTELSPEAGAQVFAQLDQAIEQLNQRTAVNGLLRPYTRQYGDEIVALFSDEVTDLFSQLIFLAGAVAPHTTVRGVFARGSIGVNAASLSQVSGEVFKLAGQAMKQLKKQNLFCQWQLGDPVQDRHLTVLGNLYRHLWTEMSPYQQEIYPLLKASWTIKKIANHLGKTPQAISVSIQRGAMHHLIQLEEVIIAQSAAYATSLSR